MTTWSNGTQSRLAAARRVADSVLQEGYVLFPYRASAGKNRYRWQFGVVVPAAQRSTATGEAAALTTECLLNDEDARVEIAARFLHLRSRRPEALDATGAFTPVGTVERDGRNVPAWDEGRAREVATGDLAVRDLLVAPKVVPFSCAGEAEIEPADTGRLVHTTQTVSGAVEVRARRLPSGRVHLRVAVRNETPWHDPKASRDEVLRRSLLGTHVLLAARRGAFVSLLDPPAEAADDAAACRNRQAYPVLVGEPGSTDVVLASPIILYDHPQIAPESDGDSFDATEIDELLTLSIRSLPDAELAEARATDARAAAVIDRAEAMPPEQLERLHGAIRSLQSISGTATADPFADFFGVGSPPRDAVDVGGRRVAVGARVQLRPSRRADAQDVFAAGRRARVQRIVDDVDGVTWIGVTLDDDPGADLHEWHGRFLYFHADEIEPLAGGREG